ncbi:MAG: alkaline phosphatase [Thermomicrobiales bacterium]
MTLAAHQLPRIAQNVILFIGDGMGAVQREAARQLIGELLVMDSLPVLGSVGTSSADPEALVTDSAAAGTALATGVKTYNGGISTGLDGSRLPTILEIAKCAGMATGLVTTCQITDATPAAFAAHVSERSDHSEIARQYIEATGVDVILGGGEDYWYPDGEPGAFPDDPGDEPAEYSRGTRGNLVVRAQELGYEYVTSAKELERAGNSKLLGLFANQNLFEARLPGEGDAYTPPVTLATLTRKALELLSRDDQGFFVMIEEAAVDRMAHKNNARLALQAVLELDHAVRVALEFASSQPETLIIITADHECGGLEFCDPDLSNESPDETLRRLGLRWTTLNHTPAHVPLNATGPGSERLAGDLDNTDLFAAILDALGLNPAAPERTATFNPARQYAGAE